MNDLPKLPDMPSPPPKRYSKMSVFLTMFMFCCVIFCYLTNNWFGVVIDAIILVANIWLMVSRWRIVSKMWVSYQRLLILKKVLEPYSEEGNSIILNFVFPSKEVIEGLTK